MPKKILLADDSITIQKVVELTFSEGDYEVITVGNGALAIRKAEEAVPDIALVDVMMPQKNGYEVCTHIKHDPNLSWMPVLLLTGTFEPFDLRRAEQAGADGHLTKPFESRGLVQQVEELLAKHPRPGAARAEPLPIRPALAAESFEVVNAGQILTPETAAAEPPEPGPEPADSGATLRIDSRAFFAEIAAPGPEPIAAPPLPTLGPLDLGRETVRDEPTGPLRAQAIPAPAPAKPVPAPEPAAAAPPPAAEIERMLAERIEAVVRPAVQEAVERVLREIAWEVLPEAAEKLVRRRIREIEDEAAGGNPSLH